MIPTNNLTNENYNSYPINIRDHLISNGIGNRANLSISSMNITTLPESISEFQEITSIYITNTPMTSLPESIGNLRNLERIVLINTSISALPESIGRTPLEHLTISNAPISSLPDSIGNINNLSLSLTNTHITALPSTVRNLSSVFSNPPIVLPPELREYMESRRQIERASARQSSARASRQPQRNRGTTQNRIRRANTAATPDRHGAVSRLGFYRESEPSSFRSNIDQLYSFTNKPIPTFINVPNIPRIREWLDRILSRENSNTLASFIIEILEYAEITPAFRERLIFNLEDALGTCDDRITLYINRIYLEKKLFSIDKTRSLDLVNFLLHVDFPIHLIDTIAAEKSISLGGGTHYREEIETYLAYLINLNKKLSLDLPIPTMLFADFSKVQPEDINAAEKLIRDTINNANEYIRFLIEHPVWIEFLQTTYPEEMNEIHEKAVDIINMENANSNDLMNHTEDAKKFRKSHLAVLTQNHLRDINYSN